MLDEIFRGGPITRPQIASATNLSKATVGPRSSAWSGPGSFRTAGQQHGRRGRSPVAYEIRGNAGFVLGIDIGGTNIRAGAADIFGAPIHDEQLLTSHDGARAVSAQVIEIAGRVAERARATHGRLLAAAVSTPGVVDQVTRRVTRWPTTSAADGGLDPLAALRARFDVPVRIENNVNLAALGESWEGLARNVPTFAFVSIGAGVGMGLVVDGELVARRSRRGRRDRISALGPRPLRRAPPPARGPRGRDRRRWDPGRAAGAARGRELESVHERVHARARR